MNTSATQLPGVLFGLLLPGTDRHLMLRVDRRVFLPLFTYFEWAADYSRRQGVACEIQKLSGSRDVLDFVLPFSEIDATEDLAVLIDPVAPDTGDYDGFDARGFVEGLKANLKEV